MKNSSMHPVITPKLREVRDLEHYRPAVAIVMPFEPKMTSRSELMVSLTRAADMIENKILEDYAGEMSLHVIHKLKEIVRSLNFNTHKKSLAIYVSPLYDKVLYLDIPVEERVIVDEDFNIRDLLKIKKRVQRYLVLVLSDKEYHMYFGSSDIFTRIVFNTSESVRSSAGLSADTGSDADSFFFERIDKVLDVILSAYRLPLFVVGNKEAMQRFQSTTEHRRSVIDYIADDLAGPFPQSLKRIMAPYTGNWEAVHQKDIRNQLMEAEARHKLVTGMQDVLHEAFRGTGRLMVVQEQYTFSQHNAAWNTPMDEDDKYRTFSYAKDAVDDAIEKVLCHGGDVELVARDVLRGYSPIALLKY